MNIYVLRHGIAEEPSAGAKDADRRLTKEGQSKLRGIAKTMQRMELGIRVILSSPYIRARQTADQVLGVLGTSIRLEETNSLAPSGSPTAVSRALQALKPTPESVLVVGHEPNLSDLVSWLVAGKPGAGIQLKKGGLCKVSCENFTKGGGGTLEWLLTPKQMLSMYADKEV